MVARGKVRSSYSASKRLYNMFKDCQANNSKKRMASMFKSPIIKLLFKNWMESGSLINTIRNHDSLQKCEDLALRLVEEFIFILN